MIGVRREVGIPGQTGDADSVLLAGLAQTAPALGWRIEHGEVRPFRDDLDATVSEHARPTNELLEAETDLAGPEAGVADRVQYELIHRQPDE